MPRTLAGIGTRYCGKSDLRKRPGTCGPCGVLADLTSYDTRLWFVFFVPLVPLGRKRIIDFCPRCRGHRVMGRAEWEGARRGALEKAMQKVVRSPDDAGALLELHGTCLLFGEGEKAEQLEQRLEKQFPDDAKVQIHLASAYGYRGRTADARRCLDRARQIDPEIEPPMTLAALPSESGGSRAKKVLYGILGIAVLGLLGLLDRAKALSRDVHIVNGYSAPLSLRIPGVVERQVGPLSRALIEIPEGSYTAQVSGPVTEEIPFTISSHLLVRIFDDRIFVLNPGGAAIIVRENAVYTARSSGAGSGRGTKSIHYGKPFASFNDIDYVFKEFPREITTKETGEIHKRRIYHFTASAYNVFTYLLEEKRAEEALGLAEWGIDRHPERAMFLTAYAGLGRNPAHRERVVQGFRSRLGRRPVDIPLHRAYQDLHRGAARKALEEEKEYEAFLKAEPTSSALLYLRGRLVSGLQASAGYFERAVKADPKNGYAHFALSYGLASRGRWKEALEAADRACGAEPGNALFEEQRFEARVGLGDLAALEKELLERATGGRHADFGTTHRLVGVTALRGNRNMALGICEEFVKARGGTDAEGVAHLARYLRCLTHYESGDFVGLEAEATKGGKDSHDAFRLQALVELGRLDEAEKLEPEGQDDAFDTLALGIAWMLKGDPGKAAERRKKASEMLKNGDSELAAAAALLAASSPPDLEEVLDLEARVGQKAILATALAQAFPDAHPGLRGLAKSLNVQPGYPRHLLSRALAALEKRR